MAKRMTDEEIAKKAEELDAELKGNNFPPFMPEMNEGERFSGHIQRIRLNAFKDGNPAIEVINEKGNHWTLKTRKALINPILSQNGAEGDAISFVYLGMTKGKDAVQPYHNYNVRVMKE